MSIGNVNNNSAAQLQFYAQEKNALSTKAEQTTQTPATALASGSDSVQISDKARLLLAKDTPAATQGNGEGIEPPKTITGNGEGIEPPVTLGNGEGIEPPKTITGNGEGIEPPVTLGNGEGIEPPKT